MSADGASRNGDAGKLEISRLVVDWDGRTYEMTADTVLKAFEASDVGSLTGPHARYFIDLDGELKGVEAVFRQIVPVPEEEMTPEIARQASDIIRSLGFIVLDGRSHHSG